jgi:hypothetical protein
MRSPEDFLAVPNSSRDLSVQEKAGASLLCTAGDEELGGEGAVEALRTARLWTSVSVMSAAELDWLTVSGLGLLLLLELTVCPS